MRCAGALLLGCIGCTAVEPAQDAAVVVDASVAADIAVAAAPDLMQSAPDLLITGVVPGKDLRGNSLKLGDGEWNLAGVPPEGTFVAALSDDTTSSLAIFDGANPPLTLDAAVYAGSVRVAAGEAVYFSSTGGDEEWWQQLGGTPKGVPFPIDAVSSDGTWIAGGNGSDPFVGPREGPFEQTRGPDVTLAPMTGRIFLSSASALETVPPQSSIAAASLVCNDCWLDGISPDGRYVATHVIDPTTNENAYEIRDGNDPTLVVDSTPPVADDGLWGPPVVSFVGNTNLFMIRVTVDCHNTGSCEISTQYRDFTKHVDVSGGGGDDILAMTDDGMIAFGRWDLVCTDSAIGVIAAPDVPLASYYGSKFLAASNERSWAIAQTFGWCYLGADKNVLVVHAQNQERLVMYGVDDSVDGIGVIRFVGTSWMDPDRLFFVRSSTLYLLETSVDPWTVSPVADHVGQYIWNGATNRLFYTVRNAGSDDGIYVKSL